MDDVFAKGGKVLDDLSEMGYVVAELASWVGPTLDEVAQGTSEVVGKVVGKVVDGGQGTLEGVEPVGLVPQRLAVTQQIPSQRRGAV